MEHLSFDHWVMCRDPSSDMQRCCPGLSLNTHYRQISNIRCNKPPNLNVSLSSCICLCASCWSQVLSGEWRCSWSSADRNIKSEGLLWEGIPREPANSPKKGEWCMRPHHEWECNTYTDLHSNQRTPITIPCQLYVCCITEHISSNIHIV